VLGGPVSGRWALVEVEVFLSRLDLGRLEAESYLLPLVEPLGERAEDLDPVGLLPSVLERLAGHLRRARAALPALSGLASLQRAERSLHRRTALLYAYAGEPKLATDQLLVGLTVSGQGGGKENPRGLEALKGLEQNQDGALGHGGDLAPRERLRRARKAAETPELENELRWLERHWTAGREERHETCVPVVERLPSWARKSPRPGERSPVVGALRRISIELRRTGRETGGNEAADRNCLWTDLSSGNAREDIVDGPIAAAYSLLARAGHGSRRQRLEGRLRFDWSQLGHEGTSTGPAIGALFYGAALEAVGRRSRLRIRPEVALTGMLTEEGAIRPVSEQSLPRKVETAFFSPKIVLGVPAAQEETARRAKKTLKNEYPNGRLEIVGVRALRDVRDHRRLTRQTDIGRVRHAAQRLWKRRGLVASVAVILMLSLGLAWMAYGPIDKNPVQATYSGELMVAKNEVGQAIERIEVGNQVVRRFREGKSQKCVGFADVTGDGQNEIFWAAAGPSDGQVLRGKAVGADTLLWERPLSFDVSFPEKPAVVSARFRPRGLLIRNLVGDKQPELYVTAVHETYFPALLLQLRPTTGAKQQRYLHPGHFSGGMQAADIDRDATRELLAGGYSNAFGDPFLAVLDPRRFEGHAPTRGAYAAEGPGRAPHHAYLRFPPTKAQKEAPATNRMVRRLNVESSPWRVTVEYRDGRLERADTSPYVLMHLARTLRPIAMGTSSLHDRLVDKLVGEGRLGAGLGPEDFRRYQQQIQYWTGAGWTTEPTVARAASNDRGPAVSQRDSTAR